LPLIEKRFPVEILKFMGRPLGSKNKRTLLMEQRIRERGLVAATPIDSLKIMEDCVGYFYRRFLALKARAKGADDEKVCDAARDAFVVAEKMTPYRHPRMATMKIAHDPNGDRSLNDLSREEVRQKVIEQLQELEALGCFQKMERPANTNRGNGSVS
jgi:hypothetical protein